MEDTDRDRQRAEVFDALGHPARISILKILSEESLGFADLKKKMGTESSGHLQHHLSKLNGLIGTDEHGKYCLSGQGKDALFAVQTVEKVLEPRAKQAGTLIHSYSMKTKTILTCIIVILTATSMLSGFLLSNGGIIQSQYFYDVVVGSPLRDGAQVSLGNPPMQGHHLSYGGSYQIPPRGSFNYTAKVFFHSLGYGYAGDTYLILDMLEPPMSNSTFYRQSFVGFEMEILNSTGMMDIFFRPATAPNAAAAEEVINPYGLPPYNTTTSTGFNITIGPGIPFERTYIVPTNIAGNYTVSISNIGNSTINGKMTIWPSVVTMSTKSLKASENFPPIADIGTGQIARMYSKPTSIASVLQFATAVSVVYPLTISALCIYLINRKH